MTALQTRILACSVCFFLQIKGLKYLTLALESTRMSEQTQHDNQSTRFTALFAEAELPEELLFVWGLLCQLTCQTQVCRAWIHEYLNCKDICIRISAPQFGKDHRSITRFYQKQTNIQRAFCSHVGNEIDFAYCIVSNRKKPKHILQKRLTQKQSSRIGSCQTVLAECAH